MSNIVIQIEDLWKEYRLGVIGHGTLTRDLQSWWARVRGKEDPNSKIMPMLAGQEKQIEGDRFWALRGINLEVKEGEILGIIGRNGAGKSTLLKLLSRVTAPTKGQIKIKGRIASLLEVGTGFHPELTGRENIFMNGAILGMSKQEIRNKLDEIIDFSGVENFIDTPVKRYSSGMYVRLAFAVAAHLEPEILVVDEVLAVGDAEFQKRCLGKMGEVSKAGRTVLFVSHNMVAIEALCNSGIFIYNGIIKQKNENIHQLVCEYLCQDNINKSSEWINSGDEYNNPYFKPLRFWISDIDGHLLMMPCRNNIDIYINIVFLVNQIDSLLKIACCFYNENNEPVFVTSHNDTEESLWKKVVPGKNFFRFKLSAHFLNEGEYQVELFVSLYKKMWILQRERFFVTVFLKILGGLSDSPYWIDRRVGLVAPVIRWD